MGFLDRIGKIASASYDSLKAPVGFVSDIATAPWRDDEVDGVAGTLWHVTKKRSAELFSGTVGGQSGVGYVGSHVADAGKWAGGGILKGLDTAYREAVSRPLATGLLMDSLTNSETYHRERGKEFDNDATFGGYGFYLDPEAWKKAYKMSKDTSPGQAFSNYFADEDEQGNNFDVLDQQEAADWAGTDKRKYISGTLDAFSRIFLDPTVVGGKFVAGAKGVGKLGTVIDKASDSGKLMIVPTKIDSVAARNKYLGSQSFEKFQANTLGKTSTEIRDTYFKNNDQGAVISTLLADAKNADEHRLVASALMGDDVAKASLAEENLALSRALERAQGRQTEILRSKGTLFDDSDPGELAALEKEIDQLYGDMAKRDFITGQAAKTGFAPIRQAPSFSSFQSGKQAFVNSVTEAPDGAGRVRETIYQKNPFSAVVRKGTTWRPGGSAGVVSLHNTSGDREMARFVQRAGLDEEASTGLRDRYMRVGTEQERTNIWAEAESMAITSIAKKHNISEETLNELLEKASTGRGKINEIANGKGRIYDGEGRSRVRYRDDESGAMIDIPLLNTQLENVHFISDLDEMEKAIKRMGRLESRFGTNLDRADRGFNWAMETYQKAWKPMTLLRLGWPQRVIADEQMRIIAKIGVMAQSHNIATATKNLITDKLKGVSDEMRVPGQRDFNYKGYSIQAGMGGYPGDAKNMYPALNRARGAMDKLYGLDERKYLAKLRGEDVPGGLTGQWSSIAAVERPGDHAAAWVRDVNDQIGQDGFARLFLQNKTVDEGAAWLRNTPEGREYAKRNKLRARNPEKWAADVEDQVRRYTLDSDDIKTKVLSRSATYDDLVRLAPDPSDRPVIHGEILQQSFGQGIAKVWSDFTQKGYEMLGELPSGFLSRNPYFDSVYRAEMKRLVDVSDGSRLTQVQLDEMSHGAREFALAETRDLLYDLGERSDLEQTLRFIAPFYGAWQEVLTRWAGIAVENPAYVARINQIWQSPERAGIVTDEDGNSVYSDGSALTADGQLAKAGKDRFLNIPLPKWAQKDWPIVGGLEGMDTMAFNKKSLNLVLSGPPGLGPVVQVPVNEIVKAKPELEDSVKWALPFGTTQDVRDLLLPTGIKRAHIAAQGEENRTFQNQMMKIYFEKLTDYELGLRDTKPTYEEAKKEAQQLANLRTVAAYVLPFQPTFKSPYQPYIDALRAARERQAKDEFALGRHEDGTPVSSDEWFYDSYGSEFFALSASLSRSNDGVPPTLNGQVARGRHKELIEKYPELGGLIIGSEGAGEFMGSAYDAQFANKVRPGSGQMQRETPSFEESVAAYESKKGWLEYGKFMDLLDAERINRGLPHMRGKKAQDLRDIKSQFVEQLRGEFKGWSDSYDEGGSPEKQKQKLTALREISASPELQGRDDIQGLAEYLELRDAMTQELNTRRNNGGGSLLDTYPDLTATWDAATADLVESNLAFGSLFYRYLERDAPEADPLPPGAKKKTKRKGLLN